MDISEKIRQQAKIDSRRFGKSTVCRIVVGTLLTLAEQHGIVPSGVFINEETGMDPINNKMLVIPVTKYEEIKTLTAKLAGNTKQIIAEEMPDLDMLDQVTRSDETLVRALRQNIILVTVQNTPPENAKAGARPETYDVLIDSVDVNQSIEARYVFRKASWPSDPKIDD
jgi:hypothetical protein